MPRNPVVGRCARAPSLPGSHERERKHDDLFAADREGDNGQPDRSRRSARFPMHSSREGTSEAERPVLLTPRAAAGQPDFVHGEPLLTPPAPVVNRAAPCKGILAPP